MNTDMRSEFVYMRYEWLSDPVWYPNIEAIFSHLILHKMHFISSFLCLFPSAFSSVYFFLQRSCCILYLDAVPNVAKMAQQNHETCPSAYPFTTGISK